MDRETAKSLLQMLSDTRTLTRDLNNKFTALEKALERYEPNLLAAYKAELSALRNNQSGDFDLLAISNLLERLSKD